MERAGIDTQATLDAVLALITDPVPTCQQLSDGHRRRFHHAWFSRIYIDAVPECPNEPPLTEAERTVFAEAIQAARSLPSTDWRKKTQNRRT